MITVEQLDADKAAVLSAQDALEAARVKMSQDLAEFDRVQQHMLALNDIAAYSNRLALEEQEPFNALIAKARSLF